MSAIKIRNLVKSYQSGNDTLYVLNGLNLEVNAGAYIALLGPSGSGKSTLLHLIGSMDLPDSGQIIINDQDITIIPEDRLADFRLHNIGFIFQFHYLLPEFTALENVAIPMMIAGKERKAALKRGKELLDYLGLVERGHHYPSELSGGEKQRVAIGRALINEPALILADEPTGNLDYDTGLSVLELFEKIQAEFNHTFILVTHDRSIGKRAKNTLWLQNGVLTNTIPE